MQNGDEVRVTDPDTGGQKGSKLARYDLVPAAPLWLLAEHYGKGIKKYSARNWERGYAWGLSYSAAQHHLNQFWLGEALDEETQSYHTVAAAWHCFALTEFQHLSLGTDDRPHKGLWLPWNDE